MLLEIQHVLGHVPSDMHLTNIFFSNLHRINGTQWARGNDKKVELLMNLLGQIDKKYHNKILEKINLEFSKDNENAKHVV